MTFLLLGLLAHVVADFVLQTDAMAADKGTRRVVGRGHARGKAGGEDGAAGNPVERGPSRRVAAYLRHGIVVFICSTAAFHLYGWTAGVGMGVVIALSHLAIDWLRNLLEGAVTPPGGVAAGLPSPGRLLLFLLDQGAHVAAIVAIWELAVPRPSPTVVGFYSSAFLPHTMAALEPLWRKGRVTLDGGLVVVLAYLFAVFAGAVMVRLVLDAFSVQADPGLATRAGRYIGMIERTLMLTLVLVDALPSIAFVLTAKSLARFRELSEMRFAEYYLIGTLTSTCVAVLTGLLARAALSTL